MRVFLVETMRQAKAAESVLRGDRELLRFSCDGALTPDTIDRFVDTSAVRLRVEEVLSLLHFSRLKLFQSTQLISPDRSSFRHSKSMITSQRQ